MTKDELDAKRFRWLMDNKVSIARADMHGPEHPELYMGADWWNEHPDISAKDRVISTIDEELSK